MRTVKLEQGGGQTDVVIYAQSLRSRVGALLPGVDAADAKAILAGLDLSMRAMQAAGATDKTTKTRMRMALVRQALDGLITPPRGGARPGAGRPATGKRTRQVPFTARHDDALEERLRPIEPPRRAADDAGAAPEAPEAPAEPEAPPQ